MLTRRGHRLQDMVPVRGPDIDRIAAIYRKRADGVEPEREGRTRGRRATACQLMPALSAKAAALRGPARHLSGNAQYNPSHGPRDMVRTR